MQVVGNMSRKRLREETKRDSRFIVDRVAAVILEYSVQFSEITGARFFTFNIGCFISVIFQSCQTEQWFKTELRKTTNGDRNCD